MQSMEGEWHVLLPFLEGFGTYTEKRSGGGRLQTWGPGRAREETRCGIGSALEPGRQVQG